MASVRPLTGPWASSQPTGEVVVEGIRVTGLPWPSPLGTAFSYAVEAPDGLIIVDLGWRSDEAWEVFVAGLARAGRAPSDVIGVVVTHAHPDHYGLASRLKAESGAWVGIHPGELLQIAADEAAAARRLAELRAWLRRCGVPTGELEELHAEADDIVRAMSSQVPDLLLEDGQAVPGTGGELVTVHTPGHTAGHTCFLDRGRRLIYTGDHLLPRVTPNISRRPGSGDDPLRSFGRSLERVAGLDRDRRLLALPGHEWAFDCVAERAGEVQNHHQQRLREIEDAVASGRSTVWQVAADISWARPFAELAPRSRRAALGETSAHLARLTALGRLTVVAGTPERWHAKP